MGKDDFDNIDLHFPSAGVDVSQAFVKQPNRPAVNGEYARTTPTGFNVRAVDSNGRYRGGSRPGLVKYAASQPGGASYCIQNLTTLVSTGTAPGGGTVQPSQSGRLVMLVAVSQGNVYVLPAGETTWVTPANSSINNPPLNTTGLVRSSVNNQLVFFADGTNKVYYDSQSNSVKDWTLTDGIFPVDSSNNAPRLTCTWRGRTVLSGLLKDPSCLFMSAISQPFNFQYAPPVPVPPDSAWSGHTGPQGLTGDVITGIMPYTDDVLIVFQDSSISLFRGDPNYGGSIDNVTTTVGCVWGEAFCMDPSGVVYFFSNRCAIYGYVPGNQPQRISMPIDPILLNLDTGQYGIRLIWNDRYKGLHVFVTLLTTQQTTQHFFWESLANAWWIDTFTNTAQNPLTVCTFDGNSQDDRVALIGGWDGYVRSVSSAATDDDGTAIQSNVFLGPFLTRYADAVKLREIQAVLSEQSGAVNYAVYTGKTAEAALTATPFPTGSFSAGRNYTRQVQQTNFAAFVQLQSAVPWAMESVRAVVDTQGAVRRRGRL